MSRKFRMSMLAVLVVGALAIGLAGTALAQGETPEAEKETAPRAGRFHFGRGPGGDVAMEAIAEALGMTTDELSLQLWAGESLADLAEEAGVELQDLRDAVTAAQEAAQRDAIEQAVEEGTITREHADWLLEGLDNGYWGGGGFGFGGHHGRGGFGGFSGTTRFRGSGNGAFLSGGSDV
jgi:hypothetical protein